MTKEAKILIGIAVGVIAVGALLAIFANPQPEAPSEVIDDQSLIRAESHMTGSPDAKVTIVEFGDFQCPACAAALPNIKLIKEEFGDNPDFNFVYRHFPLDSIHPNARIAANAAEAAGAQGKFFEMHDLLFERQTAWSPVPDPLDIFVGYAEELGLEDIDKFRSEVSSRIYTDVISADYNDGVSIGVSSTPSFFLNGEGLAGFNPEEVRERIVAILSGEEPAEGDAMESDETDTPESEPESSPEVSPDDAMQADVPDDSIDQLPPEQQ